MHPKHLFFSMYTHTYQLLMFKTGFKSTYIMSFSKMVFVIVYMSILYESFPASTRRPMDVQWMFGCYVLWTCQNMFYV